MKPVRLIEIAQKAICTGLAVIFMLIAVLAPQTSLADLESEMQQMFEEFGFRANITEPGAYDAQTRGFVVGGSIAARMPRGNYQLFTFNPPNIRFGDCGSIDLFGGAFSFINLEQFTQMLEQIGQNALGFAFMAGINAVSSLLGDTLKDLMNKIMSVNRMNLNTCQLGKAVVGGALEILGSKGEHTCKTDLANAGFGDWFSSTIECAEKTYNEFMQKLDEKVQSGEDKDTRTKDPLDIIRERNILSDAELEILRSLVGIIYFDDDRLSCFYYEPTIDFDDIMLGGDVTLINCSSYKNNRCAKVSSRDTSIEGYIKKTRELLEGITEKVVTGIELTDDEKRLINSIPAVPILSVLQTAASAGKEYPAMLVPAINEVVAASLTYYFLEEYLNKLSVMEFTGSKLCKEEVTKLMDRVAHVRKQVGDNYLKYLNIFDTQMAFVEFVIRLENISSKNRLYQSYLWAKQQAEEQKK